MGAAPPGDALTRGGAPAPLAAIDGSPDAGPTSPVSSGAQVDAAGAQTPAGVDGLPALSAGRSGDAIPGFTRTDLSEIPIGDLPTLPAPPSMMEGSEYPALPPPAEVETTASGPGTNVSAEQATGEQLVEYAEQNAAAANAFDAQADRLDGAAAANDVLAEIAYDQAIDMRQEAETLGEEADAARAQGDPAQADALDAEADALAAASVACLEYSIAVSKYADAQRERAAQDRETADRLRLRALWALAAALSKATTRWAIMGILATMASLRQSLPPPPAEGGQPAHTPTPKPTASNPEAGAAGGSGAPAEPVGPSRPPTSTPSPAANLPDPCADKCPPCDCPCEGGEAGEPAAGDSPPGDGGEGDSAGGDSGTGGSDSEPPPAPPPPPGGSGDAEPVDPLSGGSPGSMPKPPGRDPTALPPVGGERLTELASVGEEAGEAAPATAAMPGAAEDGPVASEAPGTAPPPTPPPGPAVPPTADARPRSTGRTLDIDATPPPETLHATVGPGLWEWFVRFVRRYLENPDEVRRSATPIQKVLIAELDYMMSLGSVEAPGRRGYLDHRLVEYLWRKFLRILKRDRDPDLLEDEVVEPEGTVEELTAGDFDAADALTSAEPVDAAPSPPPAAPGGHSAGGTGQRSGAPGTLEEFLDGQSPDDRAELVDELISVVREHPEEIELVLTIVGLWPGLGDILDLILTAYYLARGRWKEAVLQALSALPAAGVVVGLALIVRRLRNLAKKLGRLPRQLQKLLDFLEGLVRKEADDAISAGRRGGGGPDTQGLSPVGGGPGPGPVTAGTPRGVPPPEQGPFAPGSVGAARLWTTASRLKNAELPTRGRWRYVPPEGYHPSTPLPRGPNHGYMDRFGNEWLKRRPTSRDPAPHEWDVQLGRKATPDFRAQSPDGSHVNVGYDGSITHGGPR